jgi:hypothetical protein
MTTVCSKSVGRFDQKLAVQRLFPSLSSWSLESQLPQAQKLATRRLVPYIVRDGQLQCEIRPTPPSMAHPARRVMPNGPVGRKLQRFKCMSKASGCISLNTRVTGIPGITPGIHDPGDFCCSKNIFCQFSLQTVALAVFAALVLPNTELGLR